MQNPFIILYIENFSLVCGFRNSYGRALQKHQFKNFSDIPPAFLLLEGHRAQDRAPLIRHFPPTHTGAQQDMSMVSLPTVLTHLVTPVLLLMLGHVLEPRSQASVNVGPSHLQSQPEPTNTRLHNQNQAAWHERLCGPRCRECLHKLADSSLLWWPSSLEFSSSSCLLLRPALLPGPLSSSGSCCSRCQLLP